MGLSGLSTAADSLAVQKLGNRDGEKPVSWVLPLEDFGHMHFDFYIWFCFSASASSHS